MTLRITDLLQYSSSSILNTYKIYLETFLMFFFFFFLLLCCQLQLPFSYICHTDLLPRLSECQQQEHHKKS